MLLEPHPLDPRFMCFTLPERRIYLAENDLDIFAIVDEEDYAWAQQWRWKYKQSKRSTLLYAKRTTRSGGDRDSFDLYLHIEICKRAHGPAPTSMHAHVDHADRDSLNCRRGNVRWYTFAQNMANRKYG